jgi:hypothetical protein
MFENDYASHGIMTVGDLRKRLRRLPANAEVCFHFGGYMPAAITDIEYRKPDNPEEGEVGVVLLSPDPAGEIGRALQGNKDG